MEILTNEERFSKAYVEILEIMKHLGEDYENKVPSEILALFREKKDQNYVFKLNLKDELEKQNFLEETIGILAMIALNYWEDDEGKIELENILRENEMKYQDELREKYNHNNIFDNKKTKMNKVENAQMVKQNETLFVKVINWIKSVFKR